MARRGAKTRCERDTPSLRGPRPRGAVDHWLGVRPDFPYAQCSRRYCMDSWQLLRRRAANGILLAYGVRARAGLLTTGLGCGQISRTHSAHGATVWIRGNFCEDALRTGYS